MQYSVNIQEIIFKFYPFFIYSFIYSVCSAFSKGQCHLEDLKKSG